MIRPMRRAALAAVACAILAAASAASGQATPAPCNIRGHAIAGVAHSRVLATQGAVVVYRIRGRATDSWWACLGLRRVLIGTDDSFQSRMSEYGPSRTLSGLHFGIGGWLFVVAETGHDSFETCTKYMQYPCPGPTETLLAVDVPTLIPGPTALTRFETDATDSAGDGTAVSFQRILTSVGGAVVWLERSQAFTSAGNLPPVDTLYGCVAFDSPGGPACTPRRLAQGTIDPASVMLATTTVSWRLDGQLGVAVLH
jgi:hypothetical protein